MNQRLIARVIFCIVIILFAEPFCSGQQIISKEEKNTESFSELKDSVIKREIAFFNIAGSSGRGTDSIRKIKVNEIKIKYCTDSSISFEKGNVISLDELVSIHSSKFDSTKHKLTRGKGNLLYIDGKTFWGTNGTVPKEKISQVRYIHVKLLTRIPDYAFDDLYEPNFCEISASNKKNPSGNCKVFKSEDGRRVYIYMINGSGSGNYEVTWIIQNSDYYARVIDSVK